MANVIVVLIIVLIISLALFKVIKDKKNGVKCSGCPHSKTCSSKNSCGTSKSK